LVVDVAPLGPEAVAPVAPDGNVGPVVDATWSLPPVKARKATNPPTRATTSATAIVVV